MDNQNNPIENFIHSFKSVCSTLESNAEFDLLNIEKECNEEFLESINTLQKFNETTSGISETCLGVLNASEILDNLTKRTNPDSAIHIPYEIHSDLVNAINALYNMDPLGKETSGEKLINDKNKQLVNDLIKECEKNIYEMKDIQTAVAVAVAKSHLNDGKHFMQ